MGGGRCSETVTQRLINIQVAVTPFSDPPIIMSEPIRGKCVAAGGQGKRYLMESASGLRKILLRCNLTDSCINNR